MCCTGVVAVPPTSGAVSTDVSAVICGGSSQTGATLTLTGPSPDTVVNQPVVTLRGTVSHATQIEVKLDGAYERTIPLGDDQVAFSFDLTLTPGTHTIELTANDVCQVSNAVDSIVLTYEPVTEPTDGGTTPTEIDTDGGGIVVNPEAAVNTDNDLVAENEGLSNIESVFGGLSSPLSRFAATAGLDSTFDDESTFVGVSRVVLTVTALTAVVMASAIAPVIIQGVPGVASAFNLTGPRGYGYGAWILRAGGLLLIGLVYFI